MSTNSVTSVSPIPVVATVAPEGKESTITSATGAITASNKSLITPGGPPQQSLLNTKEIKLQKEIQKLDDKIYGNKVDAVVSALVTIVLLAAAVFLCFVLLHTSFVIFILLLIGAIAGVTVLAGLCATVVCRSILDMNKLKEEKTLLDAYQVIKNAEQSKLRNQIMEDLTNDSLKKAVPVVGVPVEHIA